MQHLNGGRTWRDRVLQKMDELEIKKKSELAYIAGISAGSLNMSLNGSHDLKITTIDKLAKALKTTSKWIIFGDDIVEARLLPVLRSFREITQFRKSGRVNKKSEHSQIPHGLNISEKSFVWHNKNTDMHPEILIDDRLVIDLLDQDHILKSESNYVLAVEESNHPEAPDTPLYFIRRKANSAGRHTLESASPRYPPIQIKFPSGKNSDKDLVYPIGIVAMRSRTYRYQ